MRGVGYGLVILLIAVLIWFGGMQYADRDNWTCSYTGNQWDMTVFTGPEGKRVFVTRNHC